MLVPRSLPASLVHARSSSSQGGLEQNHIILKYTADMKGNNYFEWTRDCQMSFNFFYLFKIPMQFESANRKCLWWEVWIYFASFTGIISLAVEKTRVTRTGNAFQVNQRAREEIFLFPDTTLDLLHAVAAEPAPSVMDTATLKGAWHKTCTGAFVQYSLPTTEDYWVLSGILTRLQHVCRGERTYRPVCKRVCGDSPGSGPWVVLIGDSASPSCSASLWHAFKRAVPTKRPIQSNWHWLSFEIPGELDSWSLSNGSQKPLVLSVLLRLPGAQNVHTLLISAASF